MRDRLWLWGVRIRGAGRRVGVRVWRHPSISAWNWDKPHRCPGCHHTVVRSPARPSWRRLYECCGCGARFARWPLLASRRKPLSCGCGAPTP